MSDSSTPSNDKGTRKLSLKRGTEQSNENASRLEERLHKVLAQAGLGSRRALEQRIADGLVKVNGEVAQTGMSIKSGDKVELDGRSFVASALTEPARVLLYNKPEGEDRKSTRLNSSHLVISYAVFCLKKKKKTTQ